MRFAKVNNSELRGALRFQCLPVIQTGQWGLCLKLPSRPLNELGLPGLPAGRGYCRNDGEVARFFALDKRTDRYISGQSVGPRRY